MESFSELIDKTVAKLGLKKAALQWSVVQLWPGIVGEMIAKLTRPLHVTDGILFVGTPGSAWANELDFQKREILERIKERLGSSAIRDIRFHSVPWREEHSARKREKSNLTREEQAFAQTLAGEIENPEVRKAFQKLLNREILHKRNSK